MLFGLLLLKKFRNSISAWIDILFKKYYLWIPLFSKSFLSNVQHWPFPKFRVIINFYSRTLGQCPKLIKWVIRCRIKEWIIFIVFFRKFVYTFQCIYNHMQVLRSVILSLIKILDRFKKECVSRALTFWNDLEQSLGSERARRHCDFHPDTHCWQQCSTSVSAFPC